MKYAGLSLGQNGLSNRYFIVAITVVLISILMYVVTSKVEQEVVNAEQHQFEFRLAELRSAVRLQEAVLVAKDQMDQAYRYEGFNPMIWMKSETSHYLGEMSLESVTGQEGNWVYDPQLKVIAYKRKAQGFLSETGKTEPKWLKFKVVALWSNKKGTNKKGTNNKGSKQKDRLVTKGLRLKQLDEASQKASL
jgi:hypothetical protein